MDFTVDDGAGNQLFNVKESKLCKGSNLLRYNVMYNR